MTDISGSQEERYGRFPRLLDDGRCGVDPLRPCDLNPGPRHKDEDICRWCQDMSRGIHPRMGRPASAERRDGSRDSDIVSSIMDKKVEDTK